MRPSTEYRRKRPWAAQKRCIRSSGIARLRALLTSNGHAMLTMTLRRMKASAFVFLSVLMFSQVTLAQQDSAKNLERVEIHTLAVQGNVYMLVGEGGNITVQIG